MALIENILNSTEASELDKLLQSFEFDNKQYVKLIEKENQQIEAFMKETEDKKNAIRQLQTTINKLDDDTKRSHRQFTQNRENCESLRKTTVVLMEHEVALHKKMTSIFVSGDNDRVERDGVLQHYRTIWEDYSATYKMFPLSIKLQKKQKEFAVLSEEMELAKKQADELKEKIKLTQGDDGINLKNLNKFIIKLAEMKLGTYNVTKQIQNTIAEKDNLEKELMEIVNNKKKQQQEEEAGTELMETNSRESIESQSTMIGMYCNRDDDSFQHDGIDGTTSDISRLNINNNKENYLQTQESGNMLADVNPRTKEFQPQETSNQTTMPSVEVTEVNRRQNEPMDISPIKPPRTLLVKSAAQTITQQPPKLPTTTVGYVHKIQIPSLFHTSSPRIGTARPTAPGTPQQINILQARPRQVLTPRVPTLTIPSQSNGPPVAPKPLQVTGHHAVRMPSFSSPSPLYRSPMIHTPNIPALNKVRQDISSPIKPVRLMQQPPQSPLVGNQPNQQLRTVPCNTKSPGKPIRSSTSASSSPKTPKNLIKSNASSTSSPFDFNKHMETMKNLKKSPGFIPLKSRAMFNSESEAAISSPAKQFLQTFRQNKTPEPKNTSTTEFNLSCFSNISSPDTSSPVFNFGADSMTTEPGSGSGNSFMNLFQTDASGEAKDANSAFSFSFGNDSGSGAQSPENGFSFNFGSSSEAQSSNVFSLF